MKKFLIYLFIILFGLSFYFNVIAYCKPKEISNYVGGRVIDERNFPVPFVKVIIKGVEAETDKLGKFKILNVTFPYDAVIAERSTSTAVIYKNLSVDNPDLILFGKLNPVNTNAAVININFPEIPKGSSAVLKFISADIYYCGDIEVFAGEKNKTLYVYWPVSENNIKGNLIFLQKNSAKYESYFNKSISVYKRVNAFEVNITGKPVKNITTSDLNIYIPFKKFKAKGFSILADFILYNGSSQIVLNKQEGMVSQYKSIIPLKLPITFKLKVAGYLENNDGSGFISYTNTLPGAAITLTPESPPELQTPSDKYLGASGNTEFYYSLGSGTGIYVVQYHSINPEMNFYIVTSERTANLTYLSRDEFKKANSVEFRWKVKKYLTYFSVDDFVKPDVFNNDAGYKAVLYSGERTFKTGYF